MGVTYEQRSTRRRTGRYYTPQDVVDDMVARALQGRPAPARVLEPSVGDGRFLATLAKRVDAELVGIDADAEALATARDAIGRPAKMLAGDALALLAPDGAELGAFDLVIGNPPYGVVPADEDREALRRRYPLHRGQYDRYRLFLEAGLSRLSPGGRLVLLLPTSWMTLLHAAPLRRHIERSFALRSVVHYDWRVFPDADVKVAAFVIDRMAPDGKPTSVVHVARDGSVAAVAEEETLRCAVRRIAREQPRLDERFRVISGLKPYQRGKGKPPQSGSEGRERAFEADGPVDESARPLLVGGHVQPFAPRWEPRSWLRYGPWLAEPREPALFDAPMKLVGRQTGDRVVACLDEERRVARDSTWLVVPRQETDADELLWLLAVLNDPVTTGLFRARNPDEVGKTFAQVRIRSVRELPCPPLASLLPGERASAVELVRARVAATDDEKKRRLDERLHALVSRAFDLRPEEDALFTRM